VTVLESQSRPGGRVLTLREPLTHGLYSEAGAIAFSDKSANALPYATAMHVVMKRVPVSSLPRVYYLRGRRFTAKADSVEINGVPSGSYVRNADFSQRARKTVRRDH
jgi:monoamine oxidase